MDVTLNPAARRISTLYTAHFAEAREVQEPKSETEPRPKQDHVSISQEGLAAASGSFDALEEKIAAQLGT